MPTTYRAKAIRFESGERFPLLVDRKTEVPVFNVIDYSLAYHRTIFQAVIPVERIEAPIAPLVGRKQDFA